MRSQADTRAGASGEAAAKPRRGGTAAPGTRGEAGGPAGDLGPLDAMIGYALRRAQLVVFDEAIKGFATLDLRPAQYSVLVLLGYRPGMRQSEVAAALGIQRANFVTLLDGLERRGLAQRSAAPNDRRSYTLHLTEDGERLLRRAGSVVSALEDRLDAKLGPGGREQILQLLARLSAV